MNLMDGSPVIEGATDKTLIGNVGDRLKVDASFTPGAMTAMTNLRYRDMNASVGGIARGTSISPSAFTTIFSHTGSGHWIGSVISLETDTEWLIKILIDGVDIFGGNGILIDDIHADQVFDLDVDGGFAVYNHAIGIAAGDHDALFFNAPCNIPVRFNTSLSVQIARVTGTAIKKFRAGLMVYRVD